MKVRSIHFLLLSLLFISSEGKWKVKRKLSGKGVYRPVPQFETEAFCPGCKDTIKNPLKWVTDEEWDAMPGGREKNPAVKMKGAPNNSRAGKCQKFGQVYKEGCWQTGCLSTPGGTSATGTLLVAWDGGHYFDNSPSGLRTLVNPGNSVSIKWEKWERGKGPLPQTTIYGDPNCELAVATYYDSVNIHSYNSRQGGQVDKDGYVYWQDQTIGGEWQWDNNEYELLTVNTVHAAHIQDFSIVEGTKKCTENEVKRTRDIVRSSNNGSEPKSIMFKLGFREKVTKSFDHSISWNVGAHASVEAGAEPFKVTAGVSVDIGGTHGWGTSTEEEVTKENSETIVVPPGKRVKAVIAGTKKVCSFDYIATVKLTYSTGQSRVVKDYGTYQGVDYGEFDVQVDEEDIN